jgi:hypothetical protein
MGDHSKEETEYPTSAPVDEDGTVPPALLMHTEEEDILRVYLMILVLFLFLGGAYCALKYYERRWIFECT